MEMIKNTDIFEPNLKYPEDFINKIVCGDNKKRRKGERFILKEKNINKHARTDR